MQCPGPLGSWSPLCALGVLCCVCGVLGHLASVHQCLRSWRCVACAVFLATWLTFTTVHAWCAVLRVQGVAVGRAHVHPDGGCLVAGMGWVPSGSAQVHPDGGCFGASRGWVRRWARTRPSRQRLVGCGPGRVARAGLLGVFCCATPLLLLFYFSFRPLWAVCAPVVHLFFFLRAPPLCLSFRCPGPRRCVADPPSSLSLAPPLCPSFRFFWPWVPWSSVLCGCPPPSSVLFFCLPRLCFSAACCLGCPGPQCFVTACPRIFFFRFFSHVVRCPTLSC